MAGIGIIANPHSKLNKRNPQRQHLLSYIAGESGHFKVTNNLDELRQVAGEFCAHEISVLAINGGDGTISQTLAAFIDAYAQGGRPLPQIVLLRGGTINMLADNLGVLGRPEQILYRLLEAHSCGTQLPEICLPTLRIGKTCGFLFASGSSARFLEEFYQNKSDTLGSILLCAKTLLSSLTRGALFRRVATYDYLSCQVDDGGCFSHASTSLFCSTVPLAPLKRRLFPKALPTCQHRGFELLSVTFRPEELLYHLVPAFMCAPARSGRGKLRLSVAKKLAIHSEAPIPYTLDGELYCSSEPKLVIEQGPVIRFLIA